MPPAPDEASTRRPRLKTAAVRVSRVLTAATVVLAAASAVAFALQPDHPTWAWFSAAAVAALLGAAATVWYGHRT